MRPLVFWSATTHTHYPRCAHSFIVLVACLNVFTCGTEDSNSSVTRVPLTLLIAVSSSPRNKDLSVSFRSGPTDDKIRGTKSRSISTPEKSNLIIGTYASGTALSSSISSGEERSRRVGSKYLKKSTLSTCFGATIRVSISEPGDVDGR